MWSSNLTVYMYIYINIYVFFVGRFLCHRLLPLASALRKNCLTTAEVSWKKRCRWPHPAWGSAHHRSQSPGLGRFCRWPQPLPQCWLVFETTCSTVKLSLNWQTLHKIQRQKWPATTMTKCFPFHSPSSRFSLCLTNQPIKDGHLCWHDILHSFYASGIAATKGRGLCLRQQLQDL